MKKNSSVYEEKTTSKEEGEVTGRQPRYPPPYVVVNGDLCIKRIYQGEEYNQRLCNFTPYIISEVTYDDGVKTTKMFKLGGELSNGSKLPEIEVNVADFPNLKWVISKWGADAIIEVGRNIKDTIRHAIQHTGVVAVKKKVFTTTGWHKIDGVYHYLLPQDDEFEVMLNIQLSSYRKENFYEEEDIMNFFLLEKYPPVKKEVLMPLISFTFLTPLNTFLKKIGYEPSFTMALVGRTGTRKSTIAALFLSCFGVFTRDTLPLSFRDTANSIIENSFYLKDVLTCVDDFHPSTAKEEERMLATAQTIFRAYGDRVGRGRLRPDSTLIDSRAPQGNVLITAEYAPDVGESGTARALFLDIKKGDVDLEKLSAFQNSAQTGSFRRTMYAYTEWIRSVYLRGEQDEEDLINYLCSSFSAYRNSFIRDYPECHGRLSEIVAWLRIGYEFYLDFINDMGMINAVSMDAKRKEFMDVLLAIAQRQSARVVADKPTHIFISRLLSLIEANRLLIVNRNDRYITKDDSFIGYYDDDYYLLHTDLAIKKVKSLCRAEGTSFSYSSKKLLHDLAEDGLIEIFDGKRTKQVKINGKNPRLMFLIKEKAKEIAELSE